MKPAACPPAERLEQFLLGSLPEEESAELEKHVSTCAECGQTMGELSASDGFIELVKSQGKAGRTTAPAAEKLVKLLQALRPQQSDQTVDAADPAAAALAASLSEEMTHELPTSLHSMIAQGKPGRFRNYRVLRALGMGGMGVVFEAEDESLQRRVALKVMKTSLTHGPTQRQRFLNEARAMAKVKDHNVVTVHEVNEEASIPFVVMELLEGEPLNARLKRDTQMSITDAMSIGRQIARGLAAAHARKLIHRDIKPANIWLESGTGRVVLLDFGLARETTADSNLTQSGAILGTPGYMAPEQAEGLTVDERCDLFSLGCVLYRLLAGVQPFERPTVMAMLIAVRCDMPTPLRERNPEVPAELEQLIARLMSKDPNGRPASARAVEQELAAFENLPTLMLSPQKKSAQTSRPADTKIGKRKARRLVAVSACLLVCVLLGFGARFFLPSGEGKPTDAGKAKEGGEQPAPLAWKPTAEQQAFIDGMALLPADKRADALRRKLIEVSGNCDGIRQNHQPSVGFEPKDGPPTKVVYSRGYAVDSIWPIAAMPSVKVVEIAAQVYDFGPLSKLPLTDATLRLVLDDTTNEAYLKAMPTLKTINGRPVADFWAARDKVRQNIEAMKGKGPTLPVETRRHWLLEQFRILYPEVKEADFTYDGKSFSHKPIIQDVTPLRGVGVQSISWEQSGPMADLRQLSGTGLQSLSCSWAGDVRDLSGLKGLPLKNLNIHGSMVADISPLAGMPLESFACVPRNDNHNGPFLLADLSPLKGMPLKKLNVMGSKVADLSPLAGLPLQELDVSYTPVKDLSPLKGTKLTAITLISTGVADLTPLAGMPLATVVIEGSAVKDLSPLKGMKLKSLSITRTRIPDLSSLKDVEIDVLQGLDVRLFFEPDEKLIRGLGLKQINGQAPDDFWKGIEKRRQELADAIEKMSKTKIDPEALKAAFAPALGDGMNTAFRIEEGKLVEVTFEMVAEKGPRNYALVLAFPSLRKLTIRASAAELSFLTKLPNLEELECTPDLLRDNLPVLRALPQLKTINGKPAKEVLK